MKGITLTDSIAQATFERELGVGYTLVGFEWGEGEPHDIHDFDLEAFGEVEESGCDSKRLKGWVIYKAFEGKIGQIINLKN